MRDFKYRELVEGATEWEALLSAFGTVKSDCLKPCATAFQSNMKRTAEFAIFPAQMSFQVRRDAQLQSAAMHVVTGQVPSTLQEVLKVMQQKQNEILEAFKNTVVKIPETSKENLLKFEMDIGIKYVETV